MATASSNVQVKFTLRGEDRASSVINNVGRSVDKFGDAGDQAADRAGKLSTALSSLGDFAGRSEGAFRQASEAAGAFDDVLTVLPGPIGIAAGAAAGLTTILVLQAKKAREDAAALRQAFGEDLAQEISKTAKALDLNREASLQLGKLMTQTGRSAASLQEELRFVVQRADEIGEDGSAAVVKFAKKLLATTTAASRLNVALKQSISLSAATAFGQAQAAGAEEEFEKRLKAARDLIQQGQFRIRSLQRGEESAATSLFGAFFTSESAHKKRRAAFKDSMSQARQLVEQGEAQIAKVAQDRAEFARRLRVADSEEQKALWNEAVEANQAANEKIRKELEKTSKTRRRAATGRAARPGAAVDQELFGFLVRGEGERLGTAALGKEFELAKTKQQLRMEEMANELRLDAFADFMHQKNMERLQQKTDMYTGVASSVAGSVAGIIKIMGAEEQAMRVQAGVEGLIALARAKVALGMGKIPQAVALAAGGAGLLAQAAIGTGGSGGGGRPSGRFFGGADQFAPSAVGATAASGGGRTVVVNFGNGVVLGNPHEVARTIKGALAVSTGTGF